jgi:hypothetical protein
MILTSIIDSSAFEPTLTKYDLSGTTNQVNLSASGTGVILGRNLTLSLPQDITTSSNVQFGTMCCHSFGVTSGAKFSYKTANIAPSFLAIKEIISSAANPLPSAILSGLTQDLYFNNPSTTQCGQVTLTNTIGTYGNSVVQYGLYGGVVSNAVLTASSGTKNITISGLGFSTEHQLDVDGGSGKNSAVVSLFGAKTQASFGYTGKSIIGKTSYSAYGGWFEARLFPVTYNSSTTDGFACGVYAKTTNIGITTTRPVSVYGLYIDACATSGTLTSWGLFEVNGVNNVLKGNLSIGKLTAPAYPLDVVGDISSGTLFRIGATAGINATVSYVDTVLGTKVLTFVGGILTAQS